MTSSKLTIPMILKQLFFLSSAVCLGSQWPDSRQGAFATVDIESVELP